MLDTAKNNFDMHNINVLRTLCSNITIIKYHWNKMAAETFWILHNKLSFLFACLSATYSYSN